MCCVAWESKEAVRIRSYHQDLLDNVPATICEAALATSAATTFFEPVTIGNRQYVDGAVRRNNPVEEVEAEAQNVWCATDHVELKSLVKCFLSIGTGQPTKKAMSNNVFKLIDDLKSFATDTEQVNKSFQDRWRRHLSERRLFRFNVEQGLQDVDLADYKKQGAIVGVTDEYMNERHQQVDLQACVENLREKDCKFCIMVLPNATPYIPSACDFNEFHFLTCDSSTRNALGLPYHCVGRFSPFYRLDELIVSRILRLEDIKAIMTAKKFVTVGLSFA